MKNTVKFAVLFCLIVCMLLSVVSCNVPFIPPFTTSENETTVETNPEETTAEELYKLEIQTVFEAAKKAGYTGTLEELIAMFKGETGPAGIDGVTPHIGANGNWWVGETDLGVSAQGIQGPQGDKGDKGDTGRGILRMELVNGELIVYYTDGTSQNLGSITGGNSSAPDNPGAPDNPSAEKIAYIIKVTDTNGNPLANVELRLYCGGSYVSLPATAANGYTLSELITPQDYTIRVVRAEGYEFDATFEYSFLQGSNVAYVTLVPEPVVTPPEDETNDYIYDMGGYIYRAYVRSNAATDGSPMEDGNPAFHCEDFWVNPAEGEPEDALSYAVYNRNQEIESDYNVHLRQIHQTINMVQELVRYMQNGDTFDLTIILAKSAASAATQNLLLDLNSLSNLNLEHEAIDQNSIRELSIGGKLYFLSGDMNISTLDSVAPTIVNLDRYEQYSDSIVDAFGGDLLYSNIYNIVRAGKWTIENMLKIAEKASVDADKTDGDLGANPSDEIGYFQYDASAVYYFYGTGGRITKINEEGVPEFVIKEDQDLFDYIFDKLHPKNRTTQRYPHGFSSARKEHFIKNADTLLTDMTLWDVRKDLYSNASFNYGLLPSPLYEEGNDYQSVVYFYNTVHMWAIPQNVEDLECAQIMFNVMAAYSNLNKEGSTMDAYYTRTLSFTIAPDSNAREMMDIIKNSTVYDIGLLYDWGNWATELSELWFRRTTNNHGTLVQLLPTAQEELDETVAKFKNPEADIIP